MIKDVLRSLAGILMTAAALVIVLAIIAVSTGITTHNLLSMLALAGTFALIAFGIQWIVQLKPQRDGENQRNQGANDRPAVPIQEEKPKDTNKDIRVIL